MVSASESVLWHLHFVPLIVPYFAQPRVHGEVLIWLFLLFTVLLNPWEAHHHNGSFFCSLYCLTPKKPTTIWLFLLFTVLLNPRETQHHMMNMKNRIFRTSFFQNMMPLRNIVLPRAKAVLLSWLKSWRMSLMCLLTDNIHQSCDQKWPGQHHILVRVSSRAYHQPSKRTLPVLWPIAYCSQRQASCWTSEQTAPCFQRQ